MRIAIADEHEPFLDFLSSLLTDAGYRCTTYRDGEDLKNGLGRDSFDLLMIDHAIAGPDGHGLLTALDGMAAPCPPVLLMSGGTGRDGRPLNGAAANHMPKAGSSDIILRHVAAATCSVLLRDRVPGRVEQFGRYRFDRMSGTAALDGEDILLTSREFQLALLFFRNPDRALSRAFLLETLWHFVPGLPTRTLDMHVSRIRSKLRLSPENGYRLQTIFGFGYRLETIERKN